MIKTIIEVFSFNYMDSTLLCGPFSKWLHFVKITQTRNTPYYTAIEAFLNATPLCRFRGITQIRIEVFSLILFGIHYVIKYGPFSKWPPYKNVESNKQSILASKFNITAPAGQRSICRTIVVYTGI